MDFKRAVCFLILVVGIAANNLAGSCVGACLEDQSVPELMLVQRQAIRMTEGKSFLNTEDQTLYDPVPDEPDVPASCSAYPKCAHLQGDCCPANGGIRLACCDEPEETPASCSAHSKCAHLQGDCCPTNDGTRLACCDEPEETDEETDEETNEETDEETGEETDEDDKPEAVGDPHLTNIRGEKFDVLKVGHLDFLRVPFQSAYKDANLTILGNVQDLVGTSDQCEQERYITSFFFGGAWVGDQKLNVSIESGELVARVGASFERVNPSEHATPIGNLLHLHMPDKEHVQLRAGQMSIDISAAGYHGGRQHFFLNLNAKSLAALKCRIGGLLGEDSHDDVSARPLGCLPKMMKRYPDAVSFATADE